MKVAQEREELEARVQPKRSRDDVEAFSKRWVTERLSTRTEGYRAQILSRLERFVWPAIGDKALDEVKPRHVLEILEARRSTPNTAEGVRIIIQQLYNYAIQKLIVETNPALPLRGVIDVPRAQHHRHLNEEELGAFWNSVARQGAHFVTIAATQFLTYTMCRKSEVIRARWTEFDLAKAQGDIPAARMKSRRPHRVYLATQAVELLTLLRAKTGAGAFVRRGDRSCPCRPPCQAAPLPPSPCTRPSPTPQLDRTGRGR